MDISALLLSYLLAITGQLCHSGQLTVRDNLYSDMFSNYSARTLPVIDSTGQLIVNVEAFIISINNFDELDGKLSVTLSFRLIWTEERISWDSSKYNNITSIPVAPEDIWRPKLFILEASDAVTDIGNASIQPRVFSNGTVSWSAGNVLKVSCSVNVAFFPFDKQSCEMRILTWDVYSAEVMFQTNLHTVGRSFYKENSQWRFESGALTNCSNIPSPCFSVTLQLMRRSKFYVIYIIVPLTFLGLINNLAFFIPAKSGERTSVSITAFLSFIVYMNIVNDVVPQSSEPIGYIYWYIMVLMIYSCIIMFLCITALTIYDREGDVPEQICTIMWYLRFQFLHVRKAKVADGSSVKKTEKETFETTVDEDFVERNNVTVNAEMMTEKFDEITTKPGNTHTYSNYRVTWYTVGMTFDLYCFSILSVLFIFFTLYIFISTSEHHQPL